jgi:hypothetical protein
MKRQPRRIEAPALERMGGREERTSEIGRARAQAERREMNVETPEFRSSRRRPRRA